MQLTKMLAGGLAGLALLAVAAGLPALAQTTTPEAPAPAATLDKDLEALLATEKEARKACKVEICSILRSKKKDGPDVACHVIQTWPKQAMNAIFEKGAVSWPWGHAHCSADVKLKRADLVAAMSEPKYEATFDPHTVTCDIERGAGEEKYVFKVTLTPKVTFEGGKAVKADLQWGEIDAPMLAKGIIWPATKLDNQIGMFSGQFVEMVNRFVDKKCDEVKGDLKVE